MDVRRDCVSYVQDERYAEGAGSAGAACVSFAQCLFISMAAKVVQCLISGHAVNPSMGARSRLPVSYGPETRHHTPSASWVSEQRWILKDMHGLR